MEEEQKARIMNDQGNDLGHLVRLNNQILDLEAQLVEKKAELAGVVRRLNTRSPQVQAIMEEKQKESSGYDKSTPNGVPAAH